MARTTIATRMCKGHNSKLGCIGEIKETEFYETWSPYTDGKVAYCKKCCDAIFNDYIKKLLHDNSRSVNLNMEYLIKYGMYLNFYLFK